ncbi:unnamed protein product, partial [Linum tenue]
MGDLCGFWSRKPGAIRLTFARKKQSLLCLLAEGLVMAFGSCSMIRRGQVGQQYLTTSHHSSLINYVFSTKFFHIIIHDSSPQDGSLICLSRKEKEEKHKWRAS